jgi:dihydroxyacetone kinase-like predicted kinase
MNPSVENLVSAIDSVHAEHVFVFPNNSNVIFAAREAAKVAKRDAHIIPTKNVAMGVAGVIACQPDLPPEENERTMTEAAERVKTGMITLAIRDTQYEELTIHEGDCIGLCNGKISVCADAPQAVADQLMDMLVTDADSLITVFYGEGVKEADAEAMADGFREKYPLCDVEVHDGGQPVYSYILSVE